MDPPDEPEPLIEPPEELEPPLIPELPEPLIEPPDPAEDSSQPLPDEPEPLLDPPEEPLEPRILSSLPPRLLPLLLLITVQPPCRNTP